MRKAGNQKAGFRNTALLIVSIIIVWLFSDTTQVHALLAHIGSLHYVGAFLSGLFFVSTFTVVPASIVLFHLAQEYNPLFVALYAGLGAMIGDFIIFRYLKDYVFEEFKPLFSKFKRSPLSTIFKTPYFAWVSVAIGAIIVASPFPDEVGIGLMGLSRIKHWQFLLLTFILNTLGILAIVLLANP